MSRPVTFEHIAFPGMGLDEAVALERDLEAMEAAARLFAAGLYHMDVDISWSLGRARPSHWRRDREGHLGAHVWVDLESPLNRPLAAYWEGPTPDAYRAAFRAGFLHGLGRLTSSPGPDLETPLERAARIARLSRRVRDWIETAAGRQLLSAGWERLESARSDVHLMLTFRGAARNLQGRHEWERLVLEQSTGAEQLLAALALAMRDQGRMMAAQESRAAEPPAGEASPSRGAPPAAEQPASAERPALPKQPALPGAEPPAEWVGSLDPEVAVGFRSLLPHLSSLWHEEPVTGGYRLAELLLTRVAPFLLELPSSPGAVNPPPAELSQGQSPARRAEVKSLSPEAEVRTQGAAEAVETRVVFLPHVAGGEVMVRIDVAEASRLAPDRLGRLMLEGLVDGYGRRAREALAEEAVSLRRALRVNWERRRRGQYRSGKHVGIANLRRYIASDDTRLFQRLEHPNELSYYFHLLVDTSYSMLEADSGAKALAVAFAFTELLTSLRFPVDVTLYASGVTQLFDHRKDRLDPYFGGDFGFLISGTMEMEAIAFAKMKADKLDRDRKIMIVITDGTPVGTTLPFVGAPNLAEYFQGTLAPWLKRSRIDLLALGIGLDPGYHPNAVTLTDSWDSIGVFTALLEELVAEGTRRTSEFWR